jgi:1-acyl-sn-glycerol-3-phosphate acyltransferase
MVIAPLVTEHAVPERRIEFECQMSRPAQAEVGPVAFRSGALRLAGDCNAPLIPVALPGTREMLGRRTWPDAISRQMEHLRCYRNRITLTPGE